MSRSRRSGAAVIDLGPGIAHSINDAGQVVGESVVGGVETATEWSGGSAINLGGLPGSTNSVALGINDHGQVVGESTVGGAATATEWSDGSVIDLGGLSGSMGSQAQSINNAGQVVGISQIGGVFFATEWSGGIGGSIISLGGLPGSTSSAAVGINDLGQAVGQSGNLTFGTPESSTWAMMLFGFAGLGLAGYRRAKAGPAILVG